MQKTKLGIVLVSGGMDSVTCAAIAANKCENLAFLHLQYGQKTAKKERECFERIADYYKIPEKNRLIVDISFLQKIGGSSLTDQQIKISKFQESNDEIPTSYVPFRNAHIISTAVSWAEVIQATEIYIGANYEDSPGYPDCRPEYYETFNKLLKIGTKEGLISIKTPIINLQKTDIILKAQELKAPLELSWSCYASEDIACGQCDSCALRLRAFKKLNLTDPIRYSRES
ncbi:MAG: 7-cyano-7-deazaguanine synthase QueC [Bacteriovoracaceae bacterium]|jgi:7-cyano-7-deazaguanine synthase|nr:7-cyano-7-deazaguanine synthase QueC [Halobacteriovoraceae bacterium]MDP7321483.1 7-cyano-7-deazaguanine synthase QueC [Bacteriovoracaceae bacterium]|tara:strand:+ start:60 stop:746 length:687 start_codon:yes stop_codon:yes gene_type:complete